jgi:hypothetical protein
MINIKDIKSKLDFEKSVKMTIKRVVDTDNEITNKVLFEYPPIMKVEFNKIMKSKMLNVVAKKAIDKMIKENLTELVLPVMFHEVSESEFA